MANTIATTTYTKDTLHLFREHPGLALIVAYVLLTLIGVTYYHYFYKAFNIPIFKFIDFSDLLIAGVREPRIIGLFLFTLILTLMYDWTIRAGARIHTRLKRQRKTLLNRIRYFLVYTPKSNILIYSTITFFLTFSLYFMIEVLANTQSNKIKKGDADIMLLSFADPESTAVPQPVIVLGSTTNYLITYSLNAETAQIHAVESIGTLIPKPVEEEETAQEQATDK